MSSITKKKRNSLIEFYRFFFAMNVVIGHGLFPVATNHFGPDRISVEFFFILSGFLFFNSLKKLKDMKPLEAVKCTLVSKTKPLLVPTMIGLCSNAVLNYLSNFKPVIEIFRYLWYIPAMLAVLLVYAAVRSFVKNDKAFLGIVAFLCVLCTALRYSGSQTLFYFDYIRSTASVSLGILIAYLPSFTFKRKIYNWILLVPVAFAIFYVVFNRLAEDIVGYEALLAVVLYPLLIYISFGIEFSFGLFDYLGALSFGIYAFQCPARLVAFIGVPSPWIPFTLIFILAVSEDLIKRILKRRKESLISQGAEKNK